MSMKASSSSNRDPASFVDRAKFEEEIESWVSRLNTRHKESSVLSKERIEGAIAIINRTASNPSKNLVKWAKNFYVVTVNSCHVLRRKNGNQKVASREEIYDILYEKHSKDHPGQTVLWQEVAKEYCYIPQELVKAFVRACSVCAKQRNKPKVHEVKPIIAKCFMQRIQVCLFSKSLTNCNFTDTYYTLDTCIRSICWT